MMMDFLKEVGTTEVARDSLKIEDRSEDRSELSNFLIKRKFVFFYSENKTAS